MERQVGACPSPVKTTASKYTHHAGYNGSKGKGKSRTDPAISHGCKCNSVPNSKSIDLSSL